jgi:5-methylcytosine-specific restriction endonuclease McrA
MEKVLVLNSDYTPINIIDVYKGFVMVYEGKAEIVKAYESPILGVNRSYPRPFVIRLLKYARHRILKIKPTRKRILKRDENSCVYCGNKKNITLDHILPKSRGGKNEWINLVACCSSCNKFKNDRTPEEAGMVMKKTPYEPEIFFEFSNITVDNFWDFIVQ